MKYYVFIISSRNDPLYEQFDNMRRKQMKALSVQYKFLLNGELPEGYCLADDEELSPDASFTPGMFMKFYNACKLLDSDYDFIIRVNSSTFINFFGIPSFLAHLPKEKCRAGYPLTFYHDKHRLFIAGYAMVFSKDVINYLVTDMSLEQSVIYNSPDDCSLSVVTDEYCQHLIWNLANYLEFFQEDKLDFTCIKQNTLFFRVKNSDRIINDLFVWRTLHDIIYQSFIN
jgi:hypothetical protein